MKSARDICLELAPCHPSSTPLWRQVVEAVAWEIDVGRVASGTALPATRVLARQLGLSRTTVQAAYDELASLGYVRARVGDGSYVGAREERSRPPIHERPKAVLSDPDGVAIVAYSPG
jgi:GntR family transcriptional regulator/MocR family aminotransferase